MRQICLNMLNTLERLHNNFDNQGNTEEKKEEAGIYNMYLPGHHIKFCMM